MNKIIVLSLLLLLCELVWAQRGQSGPDPSPAPIPSMQANPQDTIYKRNGEVIICKVKEIGTTEIKYASSEFKSDLLFAIEKNEIDRIVFADGKVQTFERQKALAETIERNSEELYQTQRKSAIKIDFLSPAVNTTSLTYERCTRPGQSLEFSVGAVGLGFADWDEKASGVLIRGGYKFMRNPDFYMRDMRYAHILKGRYLKTEFDFASYQVETDRYAFDFENKIEKYNLTKWAILIVFGNQWVFNDIFLIDLYSGIGLGSNNQSELDDSYPYGFTTLGSDVPLSFSFGLRIGFLLK